MCPIRGLRVLKRPIGVNFASLYVPLAWRLPTSLRVPLDLAPHVRKCFRTEVKIAGARAAYGITRDR